MNAMIATRREFTAGIGAIVVAFSIDPKLALTQQATPLPGSLAQNRSSTLGFASTPMVPRPSSRARSSSGRALPRRLPRSRQKSLTYRSAEYAC